MPSLKKLLYFYSSSSIINSEIMYNDEKGLGLLNYFILSIQPFSSLLWLIKDNSVNVEIGFLELKDEVDSKFHSN